jgi:transcriptional regulator with XRE-family HTH domain
LRKLRESAHLTQDEIVDDARQRGVLLTQTVISLAENGLRELTPKAMEEIRTSIESILTKRLTAVRRLLEGSEATEKSS